ncbi:MAG: dihydropteroate synthase [Deltaproteobacteria bacterium]|nr:dihydropteroate synthase [Deltaproteobacteria bacterium]MBW2136128.1 dihydropteroate synthase [Deltaproteobacteria bacterium]
MRQGPGSLAIAWQGYRLDLATRTHVMGILNVTPDSFSDGGLFLDREKAVEHGLEMARDGADIIDVGGESTRPYSEEVPLDEELDRVIPVIEALSKEIKIPISIDTVKAAVAREALGAGASMINDISALRFDPHMASVAAEAGVPVILMHMKGTPSDMQDNPTYDELIPEIVDFLRDAIDRAVKAGIKESNIIVDPGIGFGKTFDNNLQIIRDLKQLSVLKKPILLGSSRKSFLGHLLGKEASERDVGTMATVSVGAMNGASIVRVHDVKKAVDTVRVVDAIRRGGIN